MDRSFSKPVLDTITEGYNDLFQAEKKVADFILRQPETAVNANVSELAGLSGVSDATVIRLCKHLGYEGYHQMRLYLSADLGRSITAISEGSASTDLSQRVLRSVERAAAAPTEEALEKAAQLLLNANTVHLVAAGMTANLCMDFGPRLESLGIRCSYNLLPEHYLSHVNLAQQTDVVLAVSGSGTSKTVVKVLELAKERDLKTIAVTGFRHSPVSRIADLLLLSGSGNPEHNDLPQSSHLNEMITLELLYLVLEGKISGHDNQINQQELLLAENKL